MNRVCPNCKMTNRFIRYISPCHLRIGYAVEDSLVKELVVRKGIEIYYDEDTRKPDTIMCVNCGYKYNTSNINKVVEEMVEKM